MILSERKLRSFIRKTLLEAPIRYAYEKSKISDLKEFLNAKVEFTYSMPQAYLGHINANEDWRNTFNKAFQIIMQNGGSEELNKIFKSSLKSSSKKLPEDWSTLSQNNDAGEFDIVADGEDENKIFNFLKTLQSKIVQGGIKFKNVIDLKSALQKMIEVIPTEQKDAQPDTETQSSDTETQSSGKNVGVSYDPDQPYRTRTAKAQKTGNWDPTAALPY